MQVERADGRRIGQIEQIEQSPFQEVARAGALAVDVVMEQKDY